jgi:hypothetical protein
MNKLIKEGDLIRYNNRKNYKSEGDVIDIFALVINRQYDEIKIYVIKSNYFDTGVMRTVYIHQDNWILALPDEADALCSRAS